MTMSAPPLAPLLHIEQVSKRYGPFQALSAVTLSAQPGEVFGLLGPNGAGKTTLLRILATLLAPTAGRVTLAGHDAARDPEAVRRIVGVVNGGMGLPPRLTGREVLASFAGLYGLGAEATARRIAELDRQLDLGRTLDTRVSEYSTGMKQKVIIARAVIHDPAVLILDEAASGLDIFARRTLLDFVGQRRQRQDQGGPGQGGPGQLTLYSTHVMSEAEEVCDRVAILHQGRLLTVDTIPGILARTGERTLERAFFSLVEAQQAQPLEAAHV